MRSGEGVLGLERVGRDWECCLGWDLDGSLAVERMGVLDSSEGGVDCCFSSFDGEGSSFYISSFFFSSFFCFSFLSSIGSVYYSFYSSFVI